MILLINSAIDTRIMQASGYIANHPHSHHHNMYTQGPQLLLWYYFNRSTHTTCHNLSLPNMCPDNIEMLLELIQKFCPVQ